MKNKVETTKITAEQRELEFNNIMVDVQNSMSQSERTFSKFIHSKPIEKISSFMGSTIVRPTAILTGSIFALILSLIIYMVAKYYGYTLTNSESIIAFGVGWFIGLLIDILKAGFGKKTV